MLQNGLDTQTDFERQHASNDISKYDYLKSNYLKPIFCFRSCCCNYGRKNTNKPQCTKMLPVICNQEIKILFLLRE